MNAENVELEYQIRQNLPTWLGGWRHLGRSSVVPSAPDAGRRRCRLSGPGSAPIDRCSNAAWAHQRRWARRLPSFDASVPSAGPPMPMRRRPSRQGPTQPPRCRAADLGYALQGNPVPLTPPGICSLRRPRAEQLVPSRRAGVAPDTGMLERLPLGLQWRTLRLYQPGSADHHAIVTSGRFCFFLQCRSACRAFLQERRPPRPSIRFSWLCRRPSAPSSSCGAGRRPPARPAPACRRCRCRDRAPRSLPTIVTFVSASGPFPMSVAPFTGAPTLAILDEVGLARREDELARGDVDLPPPKFTA